MEILTIHSPSDLRVLADKGHEQIKVEVQCDD